MIRLRLLKSDSRSGLLRYFILLSAWFVCGLGHNSLGFAQEKKNHSAPRSAQQSLEKAVEFLKAVQSPDGAWKATEYGTMKSGAVLTVFSLYTISHLPPELKTRLQPNVERGFGFLKKGIAQCGYVCNPDSSLDYPVYGSAMLLTATRNLDISLDAKERENLIRFLLKSQCVEGRGFAEDNPNFGGWDILGPDTSPGKTTGTNVSVTRFVLEALSFYTNESTGVPEDLRNEVMDGIQFARHWNDELIKRSGDGGFHFTPHPGSNSNKAGELKGSKEDEPPIPISYGTATCDGLGILSLLKADQGEKPFAEAKKWLSKRPTLDLVPGFLEDDQSDWAQGLHFYYLASVARALEHFPPDYRKRQLKRLAAVLTERQLQNGSWQSQFAHMRENEPLIATGFAMMALSETLAVESDGR